MASEGLGVPNYDHQVAGSNPAGGEILPEPRRHLNFYRRHSGLVEKYNVSFRKLLQQVLSEPEFYGELVYRIRNIVGKSNFTVRFRKLMNRYKRIYYAADCMPSF